jgi:glycosyltransferase involved in cell wall biosynthesis
VNSGAQDLARAEAGPEAACTGADQDRFGRALFGRHFLHAFPSFNPGGVPIRIANILNRIGPSPRHTVVAMDGGFGAKSRFEPGIEVSYLQVTTHGQSLFRALAQLRQILHQSKPDLLLTYNWGSIEWALANSWPPSRPHLHFESGFGREETDGQLTRRVWMRRLALRRAFRLVVPSHTLVDLATRVWRFDPKKVLLIPNGVDCQSYARPPAHDIVPGFAKAPGETIIGTAAPLRAEKNVARLIEAFALLAPGHRARLLIAGDGPERAKLAALTARLGLEERVVFAGHVERVEDLLGWFDVFALSSDTEQMPNSLIQAMAAGLPVAATDVGDVKTIVAPENADFVVEKRDARDLAGAIERLLADSALRAALGEANRRRVRAEYGFDKMLRAYGEVYVAACGA